MEVAGICSICGNPGKMHTCMLCGALICSRCFTPQGACIRCSHGKEFLAGKGRSIN